MRRTTPQAPPGANWQLVRLVALALLLVVFAVGAWSYQRLHASMLDLRTQNLQAMLDVAVNALDVWVEELHVEASRLAAQPAVRTQVERLLATGPHTDANRAAHMELRRLLLRENPVGRPIATHVIDPSGTILISPFRGYIGHRIAPDVRARLEPVFAGEPVFVPPYFDRERVMQLNAPFEHPMFWVETPVRGRDDVVIATLGLGFRADQQFARIFRAAWPEHDGEVYAFDASARLLTESRYAEEARRLGLYGNNGVTSTVLALRLHEPASLDDAAPRLTALAQAALNGRHGNGTTRGVLLEPYRNYLGRPVVGAWRWLREYDMGVAAEVSADESYLPMRYLHIGIAGVLVLMLVLAASLVLPRHVLARWFPHGAGRVGPYRLLRRIGEGAISDVYLARHRYLRRPAAVKILKPLASTDEMHARFEREVQAAARLNHPNTIAIYDYGDGPHGTFYYAMEYLHGYSLAELVEKSGPLPAARAAYLLDQVCASLADAHAQGLVHRDIKPQNIMVCRNGSAGETVKVLDFGLVKSLDGEDTRDLTNPLRVLGTPLYMSPERIRDPANAGVHADIYAVGAVGFYLLTGRRLFESVNDHDLTYQILHTPPPRASAFAPHPVPEALDELLYRCVAKDPDERPASALAMRAVLAEVMAAHPWTENEIAAWWHAHPPPADRQPHTHEA
ncbi:MAG TPA: serine/threonine protein kinase [Burkholderiales bacterium]